MAYFWLRAQVSTTVFPGAAHNLGYAGLVVPANARLVKFLLHGVNINFLQAGNNQTNLGLWTHFAQVSFTAGPYNGRLIRYETTACKSQQTVFFNPLINNASYTNFVLSGDHEHGFEQKCSFGGHGKAASTLTLLAALDMQSPALSQAVTNFYYQGEFAALYEL